MKKIKKRPETYIYYADDPYARASVLEGKYDCGEQMRDVADNLKTLVRLLDPDRLDISEAFGDIKWGQVKQLQYSKASVKKPSHIVKYLISCSKVLGVEREKAHERRVSRYKQRPDHDIAAPQRVLDFRDKLDRTAKDVERYGVKAVFRNTAKLQETLDRIDYYFSAATQSFMERDKVSR